VVLTDQFQGSALQSPPAHVHAAVLSYRCMAFDYTNVMKGFSIHWSLVRGILQRANGSTLPGPAARDAFRLSNACLQCIKAPVAMRREPNTKRLLIRHLPGTPCYYFLVLPHPVKILVCPPNSLLVVSEAQMLRTNTQPCPEPRQFQERRRPNV
jgi:hypothetical protein